jgi:hypothetical protein
MVLVENVQRILEYNKDISVIDLAQTLDIDYEMADELLRELRGH